MRWKPQNAGEGVLGKYLKSPGGLKLKVNNLSKELRGKGLSRSQEKISSNALMVPFWKSLILKRMPMCP